jgi:sugar (pentulose or hexulose) kinase
MRFIGIDLGTTFIKGAILDLDAMRLRHIERLPFPEPIAGLPPRHFEVDPREVVVQTRALIDRLAARAPDIAGIVMCSQMHGLVLMDARGKAMGNAITWRDARALDLAPEGGTVYDALLARLPSHMLREVGHELKPGRPLCALYWLSRMERLPDEAVAASLPDFVVAHLCGGPLVIEPTNASAHGAFDVAAMAWHAPLIEHAGLSAVRFPPVARYSDVAGEMKVSGRRIPVFAPIGDQQAALAGAGLAAGELSLNIATGSQVSALSDSPAAASGAVQVRPYFDGLYLHTITHIPAGRALNVLLGLLEALPAAQGTPLRDPWAQIAQAAARAPDNDLMVDLSFFGGAGASHGSGSISNIREDNFDVGSLFRAAFRMMAERYAACVGDLSAVARTERIVFSGGVAMKLGVLRQMIVERIGLPHRQSRHEEDALMGLLSVALVCSGQIRAIAEANAQRDAMDRP